MARPVVPAILCILDGWGERASEQGNAVALARTPEMERLRQRWPTSVLTADGSAVGLPAGQQGNSEVGHLTIGAGRPVLQDLTRIDRAISDGSFFENPVLLRAVRSAKERGARLHCLALISDGGVHSSESHVIALCRLAQQHGLERVAVHAFTDGRDTAPESGVGFISRLVADLSDLGVGRVATLGGRYYAMDRDSRWDRLEKAFRVLTAESDHTESDPVEYLRQSYLRGETDEFIVPARIGTEYAGIQPGDVLVHCNFRPDRARELCHALVDPQFTHFSRQRLPEDIELVTFTRFDDKLPAEIAFPKEIIRGTLAEQVSDAGLGQFHIAETEKYAHVTYFLNGGREEPFPGEERLLVPSSKVATYDLAPQMSAEEITDRLLGQVGDPRFSLLVVNYANADMVGHSGNLEATIAAVEELDHCLGRLATAAEDSQHLLAVTADHGNAELKVDPKTGAKLTAHTNSPVPFVLALDPSRPGLEPTGTLADVAPTLLRAMGIPPSSEMSGRDLRRRS